MLCPQPHKQNHGTQKSREMLRRCTRQLASLHLPLGSL